MKIKPNPYLKNITCLYVEDDASIREPFATLITRYFQEVYIAQNGKEGVELFRKYRPSIVISDIRMPVMDGIEMVRRIKADAPDTLVVFITAFSDVEYLKEAIELGVDGYINKPVDKTILLHKLNKFAEYLRQKTQIQEYTELLREILDKQETPIILLEQKEKIRFQNKAFRKYFPHIDNFETFQETMPIDCEKQTQKITFKKDTITLTFEVIVKHIGDNFSLVTFYDITEYEEEILLDQLTNVYNRKILTRLLPKLYDKRNCVILLDIDDFKRVNDTYGHLVGDEVLKAIVYILKKSLRKNDIVIRFGGEEFLIILDGTSDGEIVYKIAQTLRERIERHVIDDVGHVTCSFGVCCMEINDESGFLHLVDKVDGALYEAKRNGKNRVEFCRG